MRRYSNFRPDEIEADFSRRVMPALNYCLRTGNAMTASIFISLAGLINSCHTSNPLRAACFSYGSGCCSEFFSGIIFPDSRATLARFEVESSLNARHQLSLEEYDDILSNREATSFGIKDCSIDSATYSNVIQRRARYPCLLLREISNFQRDYVWAHELSSD
ncbi:hydroxymethylglutaryl-CoA synthase [Bradyrhizobium sp. SZCCHNRI2049]|uniref:hydroxymethylglutaryl-CoA synthase n=1 Tax=Bradyrhizobium sp. SZCCHNRI2049 TaxID=3057287 RepID=UPI0039677672